MWALWHSRELQTPAPTLADNTLSHHQQQEGFVQEQFIDNAGQKSVHSATLTTTGSGEIIALWFAGSREGAADVAIYQSRLTDQQWSPPKVVLTRSLLSRNIGRYIAKLGNPVLFTDSRGRVWLFLVGVSIGGWSGSRIYLTWSDDHGSSWQPFNQLPVSSTFNVGSLVRTPPLELSDGSLLLAAYHEVIGNFPQMLRINANGRLVSNQRLDGPPAIQSSLCRGDNNQIFALTRNASKSSQGRRVLISSTDNAGKNWQELRDTNIENPHSSIVCLQTANKQWILIGNRSENDRSRLSLATSSQPLTKWHWSYDFENKPHSRFSYPSIISDNQGNYHLLYSWNRKKIKHITFNLAWLQQHTADQ